MVTITAARSGERMYLGLEIPMTPGLALVARLKFSSEPVFLTGRHAARVQRLADRDDTLTGVRVADGPQW